MTATDALDLGPDAARIDAATFRADDAASAWYIASGEVDLFMSVVDDEEGESRWHPLMTCPAPAIFPGLPAAEFTLICRVSPGARVERIPLSGLPAVPEGQHGLVAEALDTWLEQVLERLALDALPPRDFLPIEAGETADVEDGDVLRPVDGPLWIQAPGLRLRGRASSRVLVDDELAPVGRGDWMTAEGYAHVAAYSTLDLLAAGRLLPALEATSRRALTAVRIALASEEEEEKERIAARLVRDEELHAETDRDLARLMEGAGTHSLVGSRDPALAALSLVADDLGVSVHRPPVSAALGLRVDELAEIVRASGLYAREVTLRSGWHRGDAGPMVGFLGQEKRPVALLRRALGYELHDPTDGTQRRITTEIAAELDPTARAIYRQLPARPLTGRDLVRFGALGTRRDLAVFLVSALVVAGLGLLVPIAGGEILGTLVPNGDRSLITKICLGLLVAGTATLLFAAVQNLAALRVEGRLQSNIQEGIWGRIMKLPPSFFRRYSIGDLATRSLALTQIQELLGNLGIKMAIASVTLVVNLGLIIVYDVGLGLVTLGLVAVILACAVPVGVRSLRLQRRAFDHQREVNSRAFQLIGHVGKLRASAAEERAFAFWAESFGQHRDVMFAARRIQNRFAAFTSAFALLAFGTVFVFAGTVLDISTSTFFVFTISFGQALAALLVVVVTAVNAMPVVPLLEGMTPILAEVPEVDDGRSDPGELTGAIELSGVSFGYREDGPVVLDDVSLQVRPGEFVAIVGPSGSGKSTLVRLILGFEAPWSGAVLYDRQDLAELDVSAVRRQCGVVLQDSQLFSGDILSNVVGSGVYTADDAWAAIELVGMDEEIAAMPMGMFTMITEGAGTLSGGQRQRIALARALVSRPRMVFLDEATSALDNLTQAKVIDAMRRMQATRIVVAHRLSTVRDADRIVVMRAGRVVEDGTYDELMAADGIFRALAERQLA